MAGQGSSSGEHYLNDGLSPYMMLDKGTPDGRFIEGHESSLLEQLEHSNMSFSDLCSTVRSDHGGVRVIVASGFSAG